MLPILTAWRVYRPNQPQLYNARMPLVSMLLPVHNTSATLGAALYLLAGPLHNRERVIILGRGRGRGDWQALAARRWRHF